MANKILHNVAPAKPSNPMWCHFCLFSLTLGIQTLFCIIIHLHRCCSLPVECYSLAPLHPSDIISNVAPSENSFLIHKLKIDIPHYSPKQAFAPFDSYHEL